jgi:hypothetical protein
MMHSDWRQKMSDPVNWERLGIPAHAELFHRIRELVGLRVSEACLWRKEVRFFGLDGGGFHPSCDQKNGDRVFAYCRTGGKGIGQGNQVVVICNAGPKNYPGVLIRWDWPKNQPVREIGTSGGQSPLEEAKKTLGEVTIALKPFQTRVFHITQ